MKISDEDRDYAIRTIVGESAGEPDVGQRAVAGVILNRLASGKYGDSAKAVVLAKHQFEPWTKRSKELLAIDPASPAYKRAAAAFAAAEAGDDPSQGATHFFSPVAQAALGRKVPNWAQGEGLRIGGHSFFAPEGKVERMASNDDGEDLLKAFLPGAQSAPAAAKDDDGESLLRSFLPPPAAKPAAKVETAASETAPNRGPASEGLTVGDLAKNPVVRDVSRGARNVIDTGAEALSGAAAAAADWLYNDGKGYFPKSVRDALVKSAADVKAVDKADREAYEKEAGDGIGPAIGRVVGELATAGPVLKAIGIVGAPVVNKLLGPSVGAVVSGGYSGNKVLPAVASAASRGAMEGAGAVGLASSGYDESLTNQLLGGAGAGGAIGVAGRVAGKALVGSGLPKATADLAAKARDKFGIDIHPGQLASSPVYRFVDDVVNFLPFSGGAKAAAGQQAAFNRGVASTFGETADRITPEVMATAKKRIGQDFENAAKRTPAIVADKAFENGLIKIAQDAQQVITPAEFDPLKRQVLNIARTFGKNGSITGETYQALTKKGAPLDRLIHSSNPNLAFYGGQLREVLTDVFERSAPKEVVADLRRARAEYRALKTVEPLAAKASDGNISPAALMNAVKTNLGSGMAYGAGGDLADLARVGQRFLKSAPSSGTAERSTVINALLGAKEAVKSGVGLGAAGGAAALTGSLAPIGALAGYGIAMPMVGKAVRSKRLANRLIDRGTGARSSAPSGRASRVGAVGYNRMLALPAPTGSD